MRRVLRITAESRSASAELRSSSATRTIPIIMLTGIDYDLGREMAASRGVNHCLAKPFKPQELRDVVTSSIPAVQ